MFTLTNSSAEAVNGLGLKEMYNLMGRSRMSIVDYSITPDRM